MTSTMEKNDTLLTGALTDLRTQNLDAQNPLFSISCDNLVLIRDKKDRRDKKNKIDI